MQSSVEFQPPPDFVDPRLSADFDAEAWPLCNGEQGPAPGSTDLYDRRCVEFLALYYRLNRLNQRLLVARQERAAGKVVRSLVAQVNRSCRELEALEDRYAPIGFFGEPDMTGVFYREITFVRPDVRRRPTAVASFSSHIAIPGLELLPPSELRGTARIIRIGYGKMDI